MNRAYYNPLKKREAHGLSKARVYVVWRNMISRCYNPRRQDYPRYGGAGVTVCESWRLSFATFWRDMGEFYSKNMTIDRIDNSKGYSKSNCRWVTLAEQARNHANNVRMRWNGIVFLQVDAHKFIGASPSSIARASMKARKSNRKEFTCKGQTIQIL